MRRQRPSINLTAQLEGVVRDLCARVPEFAHIQPGRILLCLGRTRGPRGGVFAKIVPMRFPDGTPFKVVKEQQYALPQIPTPDGPILYLIYIYVPRFFEQSAERRLLTLIHELFHIAPRFDGTIRRVGNGAHGASRNRFNDNLQPLLRRYLASSPPAETLAILHSDLKALAKDNRLTGRSLPLPKAIQL